VTIKVTLDAMLGRRGMRAARLAGQLGITRANLSILKTGKARSVRFALLDSLCRTLNCQPGDLLVYVPARSLEDEAGPE
jgi:putative transcriptional regulator